MKKYFEPDVQFLKLSKLDVICVSAPTYNDDPEGGVGIDIGYELLR